MRPRGVLWFGSASQLERTFLDVLAATPTADELVVDLGGVGRLDYTAATSLRRVVDDARIAGLSVRLSNVPPHARRLVGRVLGDV